MSAFVNGALFDDDWEGLNATAEVEVDGRHLALRRLAIFASARDRGGVGAPSLRRWLRKVEAEARSQGFEQLTLEFDRVTGANPGRHGVIVIDLLP